MPHTLIKEFRDGNRTVKVQYDSDWEEYSCKLFIDGKHYEPADLFTEYELAALGTAEIMLKSTPGQRREGGV